MKGEINEKIEARKAHFLVTTMRENILKKQKRNYREIKYLTREEWQKLKGSIDDFRDKVLIELLYDTGMRVGELSKLKIEDIDFESAFIRIAGQNTKTRIGRTVYIPEETLNNVKAYLKLIKKKSGSLFHLSVRRIEQLLKKYSKKAGVKARPHTLRHSHIVHALLDKVPLSAVQKQVGHKNLATTQIYSELAPEQVKEAYERRR